MNIGDQYDLYRLRQMFSGIVLHLAHHRMQRIPPAVSKDRHNRNESAFCIQHIRMLPSFAAAGQKSDDP